MEIFWHTRKGAYVTFPEISSDIKSSYQENKIGKTLYQYVIRNRPTKIIDFGILHGYSTLFMAIALKSINQKGIIHAYDLFENYKYNSASYNEVQETMRTYKVQDVVKLAFYDFYDWLKTDEDFDLLHLDISNNGQILEEVYNKYKGTNKKIIFEGGSEERDKVEWMVKYNFPKITTAKIRYRLLNANFPSLSEMILV